ncbi:MULTISPECIES: putative metallopeptidase [unclassified Paenibacillus]|uniref:putative metallopeptidase n=1 Tax=unclassified Paenibacillus TaxID=185978 RepID=UPI0024053CB6|nr:MULTISPECIES: putative metallopeptidase [unclassified Paenibacillus]MDF9845186.1 DNA-binding Lrp family transcriptional regulator [Paenibacillus sp. PastF-2]MDF9850322.1 DNA-binding Lrp family transcriptional regulator [Paenibacillus sp. PastM-2]MDF9856975.1 DNA-binding Lrp family transcriptional regulator [Paenibacillus sp. PastF-1]MDH6482168.1 DNA-binding Lrp family transcriptional regulator [Paenibacillus sp. PastH-2]MDH6509668.1 DNA-binding Lrp family transcriptional regulator [Paenibac
MSNAICQSCTKFITCESPCAAIQTLYQIYDAQDEKDKTVRIRNLKRQLGIQDAEPSRSLKRLADQIIKRFPEFSIIREFNIKIGYVVSQERKRGEKITYADCRKVQEVFRAYLPYDFIITFYERNTGMLNENQQKVLMLHELRHITIGEKGLKIRPHDIEDFKDILEPYGLDWNEPGKELPDILGGE